jgi:hypothetical protein
MSLLLEFHTRLQEGIMYESLGLPVPSHFHFHLNEGICSYEVYEPKLFVVVLCSLCILCVQCLWPQIFVVI